MAGVDVSTTSDLSPAAAWKLASDLSRFGDWMTIFGGWRGEVPSTIKQGTEVSSLIKVKGFRNVIHWEVTQYHEPTAIELAGRGRGGVHITVAMKVTDNKPGSTFELSSTLSGGLLNGPLGKLVAKVIKSDVRKSVSNLASLE
ncbi:type II toxin-antitoxin system Rv0910 family toxin [Mycobacterium sp.]|uniref:type II toxin-antitoxin system Rv0910 family toxin n=1 Tax=Mycobacterium sp. TaxID=1785 RepID=UPI003D0D5E1D